MVRTLERRLTLSKWHGGDVRWHFTDRQGLRGENLVHSNILEASNVGTVAKVGSIGEDEVLELLLV